MAETKEVQSLNNSLHNVSDNLYILTVCESSQLRQLDLVGLKKITGECLARVPDDMPRLTFLDLQQCNGVNQWITITLYLCKLLYILLMTGANLNFNEKCENWNEAFNK